MNLGPVDLSKAVSSTAQQVVDHLNGEAGLQIPAFTPFYEEAKAEAAGDALVGIEHDDIWIDRRAKELYREDRAKRPKDELPEYISQDDLVVVIKELDKDEYKNAKAQRIYNGIIAEHYKKAEVATRETISREAIIQEEIDKRLKVVKEQLEEKSHQERMKATKGTLLFLRSAMLAIAIPILSMLPGNWKMLQLVPVAIIFWMNWKPMREMHKMMRDIQNERVSPS